MIRLVALDLILWIVRAGVVDVAFVIHVFGMHPHDPTGDPARFGIPAHVIAELETSCHSATQEFDDLAASELTDSSRQLRRRKCITPLYNSARCPFRSHSKTARLPGGEIRSFFAVVSCVAW